MKYSMTNETKDLCGHTLYRIVATRNFGSVKKGEKGGWIEDEQNLSQYGDCWIADEAIVYGNAQVIDDAFVGRYAQVTDNACVAKNAWVGGFTKLCGDVKIGENAFLICNGDWIAATGLGAPYSTSTITAFRTKDGVGIVSDILNGSLEEFANSAYIFCNNARSRELLSFVQTVKIHFGLEVQS